MRTKQKNDPNLNWAMYNAEKASPSKKQNTKAELHRVSRTQVVAGSPAIWANRLAKTISEREHYKAHAEALAEALRQCLHIMPLNTSNPVMRQIKTEAWQKITAYENEARQ